MKQENFIPLELQFFAEEELEQETSQPDSETETQKNENDQHEKTFTQAELDLILKERLNREREKQPKKEDYEAFKAWQESQKTSEQQTADALEEEKKKAQAALEELNKYKQLDSVRKLNIEEEYVDYVNFKVSELAKAQDINFNEALTHFMKKGAEKYTKQETRNVVLDTAPKGKEQPTKPMGFSFTGVRPQK